MAETIIIEDNENEDGSVLAEAAVAAAAVSGAAHAQAADAAADAEEAEATAELALHQSTKAAEAAVIRPTFEESRAMTEEIVDDKIAAALNRLAERLAPATVEAEVEVHEEPPPDEPPSNLKKKTKKKRTFAERYLGMDGEE